MEAKKKNRILLQAAKIGVGSSAAIFLAETLNLQFAASAGTIALLTIVTTKWETLRLSLFRIVTFLISVFLAWAAFATFKSEWVAYGVYIFIMIVICELYGWKATISVNSVIGVHFMTTRDFSVLFVLNELGLVVIGISVAIVLNLFHNNTSSRRTIVNSMRETEQGLQKILEEVAAYLTRQETKHDVWEELKGLERRLHGFIGDAYDYQGNTFQSHPGYYIDYFEMRLNQCGVLHNLHNEMRKIRKLPEQAAIVADYVSYLTEFVVEHNIPDEQIARLEQIFETMRQEPLPQTQEEFENRAILYHILMDLEEFLIFKKRFVKNLDEVQRRLYWEQEA